MRNTKKQWKLRRAQKQFCGHDAVRLLRADVFHEMKSLRVLDLRSNSIDISQAQFYEKILLKLQQLPKLMSLYFQGNPVVIKIPLFRFFVIHELVKLEILDDAKITKSVIIFHLLFIFNI